MKYIILIILLISCEKLNFKKYDILTIEGRITCEKQVDTRNYTDCVHIFTGERISNLFSGDSVVLELDKE